MSVDNQNGQAINKLTDGDTPAEERRASTISNSVDPRPPNTPSAVAVTGSPNSTMSVQFDVRSAHLRTPLLGKLLALKVVVQTSDRDENLIVLGQVTTIRMQNRWHEEPSLKNYIKMHGRLPHLTEVGDTVSGTLHILGAYRAVQGEAVTIYEKAMLCIPPGSGLEIHQVNGKIIQALMRSEVGYGFLGSFYGSPEVSAPVYVRHFGDVSDYGFGEAYMGGCFGPAGSGKSVLAATLVALFSHNPRMGILLLDPQSEFSENALARGSNYQFNFHHILEQASGGRFNPGRDCIRLDQLQLEGPEMFTQVLTEKKFFKFLGLSTQKVPEAIEFVVRLLEDLERRNLWNTSMDWSEVNNLRITTSSEAGGLNTHEQAKQVKETFAVLFTREVANAYAVTNRTVYTKKLLDAWQKQNILERVWDETIALFKSAGPSGQARVSVRRILEDAILNGHVRILDLNPQSIAMSERFKLYLIDFVFKRLRQISHIYYRRNQTGNCLIVLDEAGRYVPQDAGSDTMLRELCKRLTDSVKEMRKMRCGFLFITQTTTEIQKDILRNLHFRIYGVGLSIGADADNIRSLEGNDAFELYRSLPDPGLSRKFAFMIAGRLLTLGSSGSPIVIEGFPSGQTVLDVNQHILSSQSRSRHRYLAKTSE
jgi:hypothetical protein